MNDSVILYFMLSSIKYNIGCAVMEGEQKLYTSGEVAKELGISHGHIRTMIVTGIAHPTKKIGHIWVFTAEEIERLRTRQKSKGGRPAKK
jgi:hypothetical protein